MSCSHVRLRNWVFQVNGEPAGMWSCVDCGHKFVPVNIAQEKAAARWRWLLDSKNAMATFEAAYWNSASSEQLEALVDAAMRAEQFPGVDIDAAHKA